MQGLSIDPSKLTVLQELPEVGKVVIQEASRQQPDSITTILEEMKTEEANHAGEKEKVLLEMSLVLLPRTMVV